MKKINYKSFPDKNGRFEEFGGKYVSETLMYPLSELEKAYKKIAKSVSFKKELNNELCNYVGRPTPIYHASRISKESQFVHSKMALYPTLQFVKKCFNIL